MKVLTNHYSDCELLNLGYNPNGRGPYVVRQDGTPPGTVARQEDRFFLRKDGTWVVNFAAFVLPAKEQEENFLYANLEEALTTLQNLIGKPLVEGKLPEGKSRAEMLAGLESTKDRLFSRIREAKGSRITM
jgi:hypothetical protein